MFISETWFLWILRFIVGGINQLLTNCGDNSMPERKAIKPKLYI